MNRRFLSVLLALSLTACTAGFGSEPTVAEDVVVSGTPSAAELALDTALPDYEQLYAVDYHGDTLPWRDDRAVYAQAIDDTGAPTGEGMIELTPPGATELGWEEAMRRALALCAQAQMDCADLGWSVQYYAAEIADLAGVRPFYEVICQNGVQQLLTLRFDSTTGALQRFEVSGDLPGEQPILTLLTCGGSVRDEGVALLDALRAGEEPDDAAWDAFWATPAGAILQADPARSSTLLTLDSQTLTLYETAWQTYRAALETRRDTNAPALAGAMLSTGGLTVQETGAPVAEALPESWQDAVAKLLNGRESLTADYTLTLDDGSQWLVTVDLVRYAVLDAHRRDIADPVRQRESAELSLRTAELEEGASYPNSIPYILTEPHYDTPTTAEDLEATVRTLTEYLQALENEKATLIGNSSGLYLPDGSTISYDLQSGEDPSKVAVQGLRDRITLLQRNRVRVALGLGAEYD